MAEQDDHQQRSFNIEDFSSQEISSDKLLGGKKRPRSTPSAVPKETMGRIPPQAVDVEQAVLGAMLIEREAIPQTIEVLPPDAFYTAKHQHIYEAILSLFERGNPVDLITLTEELKRRGQLEAVGGAYYVTELTTRVDTAANVEYHARIIAEKSLLRKLIETMTDLIGKSYDPSADAFEMLDRAEGDIFKISDTQLRRSSTTLNQAVKETLEKLESIHGRDMGITGVPTGFTRLDDMTGGWQRSDLVIIAARPSMGKTAFSLAMARNAALHPDYPSGVAIFSLEMSAQQLAQRLLTSEARVDAQAARTGRLDDEAWPRLARAAGRLSAAPIFIDDTPGVSILELRAKCRRLKAEHDIGLVIVDYLQLMHGTPSSKGGNREQEIAQISRSLKSLAKELDVPVIALSQLSRAVETRGGDKRPQLSDLRESGCLTGDTQVILADTGQRAPIRSLVGQHGFGVWALNPQTYKLERAEVSRAFSTGIKPTYRLTTRLGRTIRATGNHKFLTIDGWRRLDSLAIGSRLALPRHIPMLATLTAPHHVLNTPEVETNNRDMLSLTATSSPVHKHSYGPLWAETVVNDKESLVAESDIYWDQVVSIEPDGVEEVFDLTVPGLHNFVADDIIVHNSIEQDADVVAFIYRAERYGITVDEDGNSTEGLGEIILGKQRNGPIGSVKLAFVHQYARFENLTTYYSGGGADDYFGGFNDMGDGMGGPEQPPPPMGGNDAAPF